MKPSEQIGKIAVELAKKEVGDKNPFTNWEQLNDVALLELHANASSWILMAILQYLDQQEAETEAGREYLRKNIKPMD